MVISAKFKTLNHEVSQRMINEKHGVATKTLSHEVSQRMKSERRHKEDDTLIFSVTFCLCVFVAI